jgi:chemotaxis protein CheZ
MKTNEGPAAPAAAGPEVFQQLGQITRQLHEALNELGVMPRLQSRPRACPTRAAG